MASMGAIPSDIACCASLAAVSGAPSIMLCRIAEKLSLVINSPCQRSMWERSSANVAEVHSRHADLPYGTESVIKVTKVLCSAFPPRRAVIYTYRFAHSSPKGKEF
jgi:hypothetical protein